MIDVTEAVEDSFLSPREREVVEMVANGSIVREVAEAFGVDESSVRTTLKRACAKISDYVKGSEEER